MSFLGLRHIALNVKDPQISKAFYMGFFKMNLEWEPDPENVYLSSQGQDNLALHKRPADFQSSPHQFLDHIGFFVKTLTEVDEWYRRAKSMKVEIVREIKTHRDGARSFYCKDPDGIIIQVLFHPPISAAVDRA